MRVSYDYTDYEILDTSNGEKLERWGDIHLIRPDPQIIWNTEKKHHMWEKADGRYIRSNKGGGCWEFKKNILPFAINYKDLKFNIRPTNFKHTGLFPEQAVNWNLYRELITACNRPINVLNLFAYTGGATLAVAAAGAKVCHVDASKGMVNWAKDNASISGLADKPIRWIVDDCEKFVQREIKRGNRYDAIIMDPPSYGRGPNGEVWQLEEHIYTMMQSVTKLLSDNPLFFALNSYTTGLSPAVMEYLLGVTLSNKLKGNYKIISDEIGIVVKSTNKALPCGNSTIYIAVD